MCDAQVPPMTIQLASDPEAEFKALTALMKDSGPEENEDKGHGDEDEDDDL